MKSCVVTCTGGRPELFALCRRWVERCKPDKWIVAVDTDDEPLLPAGTMLAPVRPEGSFPTCTVKAHRALALALLRVPLGHHAVIMEDDDWYPESYVREMVSVLDDGHDLAGCANEVRYNVPARRWQCGSPKAANAGCTAIHAREIGRYIDCLMGQHGSDHEAWRVMGGSMTVRAQRVAIKGVGFGLPGRAGATGKHDPRAPKVQTWVPDPDGSKLRSWLGDDADAYLSLCTPLSASS